MGRTVREEILEIIVHRRESGKGLRPVDLINDGLGAIYVDGKIEFGTWRNALQEAGIHGEELEIQLTTGRYPTKNTVVNEIKNRYESGKGLRHAYLKKEGVENLYQRAKTLFGTWKNALQEAGFTAEDAEKELERPKSYTPEEILESVRISVKNGNGLWVDANTTLEEKQFLRKINKCFGSIQNAVNLAGVKDEREKLKLAREVSKLQEREEQLVKIVKDRVSEGESINRTAMEDAGHTYLMAQVAKEVGWKNYLISIGFNKDTVGDHIGVAKYGSKKSIKEELQRRYENGEGTRCSDIKNDGDQMLYVQGLREYGKWELVLEDAGVPKVKKDKK